MNRIGLIAMLAAVTVPMAYAATRYDPAIPSGMIDQPVQPSSELAKPEAKPETAPKPPRLVQNEKRHARDADARACLDQASTNKAIHRCSLKYRSHASHDAAPVKKASAKSKAAPEAAPAPAIEMAKPPADAGKAAPPKPADTAKAADLVKPVDVTKAAAVPKAADTAKPEAAKSAAPAAPAPQTPPPPPAKAPEPAKK